MKNEYVKPEAEIVSFEEAEKLMVNIDDGFEGEFSTGEKPEVWD